MPAPLLHRLLGPESAPARRAQRRRRFRPPLEPLVQRAVPTFGPAGAEFRANAFTTDTQFVPRLAADADGDFVVVWESNTQDGSSNGVYAQRYSSSGSPLGGEFSVNTYTTSAQSNPAVAMD